MSPEHHLATTQESLESTRELLSFYGKASSDFYDCSSAQLVWSSRVHLLAMPSCRPFSLNFELYDHPSHRFLTFKTSEVSASFASSKNNRKYQVHFSQFLLRGASMHLATCFYLQTDFCSPRTRSEANFLASHFALSSF